MLLSTPVPASGVYLILQRPHAGYRGRVMERFTVAHEVVSSSGSRSVKPVRDEAYRRFVRSFACSVCARCWRVDACHTGPHGISQKACDWTCIPLCRVHHREYDRNPRGFAAAHGLDVATVISFLRSEYQRKVA